MPDTNGFVTVVDNRLVGDQAVVWLLDVLPRHLHRRSVLSHAYLIKKPPTA